MTQTAQRRQGLTVRLTRRKNNATKAGGFHFPSRPRIARRPKVPRFWRNIAPTLLAAESDLQGEAAPSSPLPLFQRQYYWRLVLSAKGIPHSMPDKNARQGLYVPPVTELAAVHEILALERERPDAPIPPPPLRDNTALTLLILCCLLPLHALRWSEGWLHAPFPETPDIWLTLGGLDAYKVQQMGEWRRSITALTLHADTAHLTSNVVMGAVFCVPLFRRTGAGLGIMLTLLAGACGNILTAYLRPASYMSQGFSTALFASVGLLSAVTAVYAFRHSLAGAALAGRTQPDEALQAGGRPTSSSRPAALGKAIFQGLMPLGAGLALLALLGGSEAPKVDYLAHSAGLLCGVLLGLATAIFPALFQQKSTVNAMVQGLAGGFSALLLLACWYYALAI